MEFTLFLFDSSKIFSYVGKLLEQMHSKNEKTLLLCDTATSMNEIDKALWTYSQLSFLPHNTVNDYMPSLQSLLLSTNVDDRKVNGAQNLMYISNSLIEIPQCFLNRESLKLFTKIMLILQLSADEMQSSLQNPSQNIDGLSHILQQYSDNTAAKWLIYHDTAKGWQKLALKTP